MVSLFIHIYANNLVSYFIYSIPPPPRATIIVVDIILWVFIQKYFLSLSLSLSQSVSCSLNKMRRRILENANGDGFDAT